MDIFKRILEGPKPPKSLGVTGQPLIVTNRPSGQRGKHRHAARIPRLELAISNEYERIADGRSEYEQGTARIKGLRSEVALCQALLDKAAL